MFPAIKQARWRQVERKTALRRKTTSNFKTPPSHGGVFALEGPMSDFDFPTPPDRDPDRKPSANPIQGPGGTTYEYDYEIMGEGARLASLSIDRLLNELEMARVMAMRMYKPGHAILATMGKAKLAGLLVDRREVGGPGDFASMSTDQLQTELREIELRLTETQKDRMPAMITAMKRVMK